MAIADGMTKVVPYQFVKTNANTGTPVRLSPSSRKFRSLTLIGNKDYQTANTGTVYLGWSSVNGEQWIPIETGTMKSIEADGGEALDLFDIYLDVANANDGVVGAYS